MLALQVAHPIEDHVPAAAPKCAERHRVDDSAIGDALELVVGKGDVDEVELARVGRQGRTERAFERANVAVHRPLETPAPGVGETESPHQVWRIDREDLPLRTDGAREEL